MAVLSTTHVIQLALTEDQVQRVDHPAYRPVMATAVTVEYRDGVPYCAELTGKKIRNNGELSKSQGTIRFWLGGDVFPDRVPPAWVADLAERHRLPTGRPLWEIRAAIKVLRGAADDPRALACAEALTWALAEASRFHEINEEAK